MRTLRGWIMRFGGLFNKGRQDRELQDELESHIQMHVEENLRSGMKPDEARRQAMIKFGGMESVKEACREQRGIPVLETLWKDLQFGARMLRKNPGFTIVAVLTLALGIGINTGIFTILNATAFRRLPVPGSERLVCAFLSIAVKHGYQGFHRNVYGDAYRASYSEYRQFRDNSRSFSGLMAYAPEITATVGGDNPHPVSGALVSGNYFDVLNVRPSLGRGFIDSDCSKPGEAAVVILSHDYWRSAWNADPSIIGQEIMLNRTPFVVVGVAPAGFRGTEIVPAAFWAPLTMQKSFVRDTDLLGDDFCGWLLLMGRIKDGSSIGQVRADLSVTASQVDPIQPGRVTTVKVQKATLAGVPEMRNMVVGIGAVILSVTGLVLVIACANIANLLLARAAQRRKEMAVRLAIGASRWRLIGQLLTESVLLAILGGVLGSLLAVWSSAVVLPLIQSHLPHGVSPFALDVSPDLHVLIYTVLLTLITAIAFGLVPALKASQANLTLAMKEGGPESEARPRRGWYLQSGLVVTQVAACMILLLIAGLLMRGLNRVQKIDPGFETKQVAVVSLDATAAGYSHQRAEALSREFMERIAALPGVKAVAQVESAPLSNSHFGDQFSVPEQDGVKPAEYNHVSPSYFPLLRIPIVQGRNFTELETRQGAHVTIVTESTARHFWPGKDPIGKVIRKGAPRPDATDLEVVGVARDAQVSRLAESESLYVYLPAGPEEQGGLQLLVRESGEDRAPAAAIRGAIHGIDPELIVDVTRLGDNFDYFKFPGRVAATLSGVLGTLALVLALMGIYGTVSYGVSRRVREIGIRIALGAEPRDVTTLILRQAMLPVAMGVAIGLLCCAATSQILSSVLYGISPRDPVSFLFVPGFLLAVALLASWLPARRATRVDPMVALRYE